MDAKLTGEVHSDNAAAGLPADAPSVGIVLVNFNGGTFMPECLESLAAIDYPAYRVVVVDNASTDGSADWVEANCTNVTLIRMEANTGITGGNNAGIDWALKADYDYVLLLNNDTVVAPDFLRLLMEHASPDTMATPMIYFHDQPDLVATHVGEFNYWTGTTSSRYFMHRGELPNMAPHEVAMTDTCALLFHRSVVSRTGMMDTAVFLYYDDTDFITRAVAAGQRIMFVPRSVIYHKESSSTGGRTSPVAVYYLTRNRLYFMFKHRRNPVQLLGFLLFFGATRVAVLGRLLLRRQPRLARALLLAVSDFATGHMGCRPATELR